MNVTFGKDHIKGIQIYDFRKVLCLYRFLLICANVFFLGPESSCTEKFAGHRDVLCAEPSIPCFGRFKWY